MKQPFLPGVCERLDKIAKATAGVRGRPHNVNPSIESARVVMVTKNWSNIPGVCSVGLSVTAANIMRVLRRYGLHMESWQVKDVPELYIRLEKEAFNPRPITHVITSAPSFLQPLHFIELAARYPEAEFVQQNHTGTAYLSIDKFGIKNIRAVIDLEKDLHNVRVSFNNPRGAAWAKESFGATGLLLPNLYDTTTFISPSAPRLRPDPIRIGSFGAGRPWKNMLSAAEGAVQLARHLGIGLEFYINTGRKEAQWGGDRLIESRAELFDNLPNTKVIEVPWCPWPQFRKIVRTMDLLISPSFDETFNVVTADGIAEGVPSVVTSAMEWTPKQWWCSPEDPTSIVNTALGLLHHQNPTAEARTLLKRHVDRGVKLWLDYILKNEPQE